MPSREAPVDRVWSCDERQWTSRIESTPKKTAGVNQYRATYTRRLIDLESHVNPALKVVVRFDIVLEMKSAIHSLGNICFSVILSMPRAPLDGRALIFDGVFDVAPCFSMPTVC